MATREADKNIIVITGQTATGKTKLALEYAKNLNGELINSDSRQVYKYLNIITGKDLEKGSQFHQYKKTGQMDIGYYPFFGTKIWLCDVITPDKHFSSYNWKNLAIIVIKNLLKNKKTPIIVGGSYLYIYHLLYKIHTEGINPNLKLRKELESKSLKELQKILQKENPELWEKLSESDKKNKLRLIRKIEISRSGIHIPQQINTSKIYLYEKLGKEFSNIKVEIIGLKFKERKIMEKKIKNRVEERLEMGAIEETKKILSKYGPNAPGLNTIGYKQLIKYLKGEYSFEKAVQEWIKKEIQYAKRQYTFMKKDNNIKWKEVI